MLGEEKITQNKERFLTTNTKYEIFTPELVEFLGEDFFLAPFSTSTDMPGAYPGGIVHICFSAASYAFKINDVLPKTLKQDVSKILKSIFISQIGKVFLYSMNDNDWQVKNQGKMYKFNDSLIKLRYTDRSLFYANNYGVKIDEETYQSIVSQDKTDDMMLQYHAEPLTYIVKLGFELAILEDKYGQK